MTDKYECHLLEFTVYYPKPNGQHIFCLGEVMRLGIYEFVLVEFFFILASR